MRVILIADTHFGARGDSPIFHDYFSRFFGEVFFPYIDDNDISVVIHLGDLVDRRKFLTYSTANVMRKCYIEPSIERGLVTHIIAGNHDTFHKNTNEVNALREIIAGHPEFKIYASGPAQITLGKMKVLLLPWICPENQERSFDIIKGCDSAVVFAHLELVGFEMARGQMMEHGMDPKMFDRFKAVYSGHYHHKSSKGNIHYLGTPYEMTWSDCDDPKGFHVLDTDTGELEFIHNPLTLFHKIHFDEKVRAEDMSGKIVKVIVHEGANRKTLDKFVAIMEKSAVDIQVLDEHLHTEEAAQSIDVENVQDTMKIMTDYVMASELDVDKDALCGVLKELYLEAQHDAG